MLKRAVHHATHGDSKRHRSMMRADLVEEIGNPVQEEEPNWLDGLTRKDQKANKATMRSQKHGGSQPPPPQNLHARTFLEEMTITGSRMKSYEIAWEKLKAFAKQHKYSMRTLEEVDAVAAWWMDVMYFKGEGISRAMTMMAAVKHMRTDVPRLSVLVRCSRSLRAFRKLAPPQARIPLPFPMLARIITFIAVDLRQPMVGAHLALTWGLCSRPGESLKLKARQLVAPNQVSRLWSAILSESSPVEGKSQPSKTHELDESVLIDQPYMLWLGHILKYLKTKTPPAKPVFTFNMKKVSGLFMRAVAACGYQEHGVQCVYQIRHGSASTDRLTQHRSVKELMKRGRWKSLRSVRRYEQGGRLSQIFGCLSKKQQPATAARAPSRKAASSYFGPLRWMLKAPKRSVIIELFSGSGRLSKAIRRRVYGIFTVVELDIEARHDLTKRALQNFFFAPAFR